MRQIVCLIGKPNVGKSTLFNHLIKEQKAIILDTPGITRDRIYGEAEINNHQLLIIDTGGITTSSDNFNNDIKMQAELAIEEADVVIFVVDGRAELAKDDYQVRDMLIKSGKKVVVAVNKLDNIKLQEENIYRFYELGFEHVMPISSVHNKGIANLMQEVTKDLKEAPKEIDDAIRFAIIGRPNVGKSSLINALLNKERVIVSDVPGTTRDAIDTSFMYNNQKFTVIDTAGMRKKGKVYEEIERYSLLRSLKAIERSDVCCLVLSAEEGIIEHDKHILSYALDAGKAIVIVVNKWDLVTDPNKSVKDWQDNILANFQFTPYAETIFLSAKTKKRINNLMPAIINAYNNYNKTIPDGLLNECIRDAYILHEPPSYKGRRLKIFYVKETNSKPPTLVFNVNDKGLVHFSYQRYLENKIRASFDLTGTPLIIKFKNKDDIE
jgi:GTP-binding protein